MARLPARIRVNATFPFPSLVQANGPVQIGKAGGIWTIGLDPAFVSGGGANPHLIVGSTRIDGGAANNFLFDNGGILGEAPAGAVIPGSYTNPNLTVTAQGVITAIANGTGGGGGGGGGGTFAVYETKAAFLADTSIPATVTDVLVLAVTGTYPPAPGLTATRLWYKRVVSSLGLYGEVTTSSPTALWAPMYSTAPVDMGEFCIVPDGQSSQLSGAAVYLIATANGTGTLTSGRTLNGSLSNGMQITNQGYATLGAGAVPNNTTITGVSGTSPNLTVTLSGSAPAGAGLFFICWVDSISGTDNTAAMQAALDFASTHGSPDIKIPLGIYKTTDTLHVNNGAGLCSTRIIGTRRASFFGVNKGVTIISTQVDRPVISFQGMRGGGIFGVTCVGRNAIFGAYSQTGAGQLAPQGLPYTTSLSSNPNDWLAPNLVPYAGNSPTGSGGLQRYSPYCAIAVDPQDAGAPPPNPYPGSYTGGLSSDVTIEDCSAVGFGVAFCVKPYGDGNGDFVRFRNCQTWYSPYGIAVCQTQSRNVELRNINGVGHHTWLTTIDFGEGRGELVSPVDNCTIGQCYQLFRIGTPFSGPLNITSTYCENCVRIGDFLGLTAFPSSVEFSGCLLALGDNLSQLIPQSILTSDSVLIFNSTDIVAYDRISALNSSTGPIIIHGGSFQSVGGFTAPLSQAVNFCGGILVGKTKYNTNFLDALKTDFLKATNIPYSNIRITSTYDNAGVVTIITTPPASLNPGDVVGVLCSVPAFNGKWVCNALTGGTTISFNGPGGHGTGTLTGDIYHLSVSSMIHDDKITAVGTRTQMTQTGKTFVDTLTKETWTMVVPNENLFSMTDLTTFGTGSFTGAGVGAGSVFASGFTQSGDVLTFNYAAYDQIAGGGVQMQIHEGDIFYFMNTSTVYVVTSVSAIQGSNPNKFYQLTAQQQNNLLLTPFIYTITGTYNNSTGAVVLTLPINHGISSGTDFCLFNVAGGGGSSALNGQWTATGGTTGATVNFTAPAGLNTLFGGTTTITNGQFGNAFLRNVNPDQTLAGTFIHIKTGIHLPSQIEYGQFSTSSSTVSNISRGDSYAADLDVYYTIGDRLLVSNYNSAQIQNPSPIAPGGMQIMSITPGSPGSMVLAATPAANPIVGGSAYYAIFPYKLK